MYVHVGGSTRLGIFANLNLSAIFIGYDMAPFFKDKAGSDLLISIGWRVHEHPIFTYFTWHRQYQYWNECSQIWICLINIFFSFGKHLTFHGLEVRYNKMHTPKIPNEWEKQIMNPIGLRGLNGGNTKNEGFGLFLILFFCVDIFRTLIHLMTQSGHYMCIIMNN